MRLPTHCNHPRYSIKNGKRLASRYHPSRICKGIRQSPTPPSSTQIKILWRQSQNQQMDTLVLRKQKAKCNTWRDCLQAVPVLSGVPQGTVLGPLLFLAYINDMPETATSSEIKLFADDSLIYRTINNQTDSDLLQRDLTILEDWGNKWQMSFNAKKCIVIRIAPKTNRWGKQVTNYMDILWIMRKPANT